MICYNNYHECYDECYSLNQQKLTFVTQMPIKRRFAASMIYNETSLWISGGQTECFGNHSIWQTWGNQLGDSFVHNSSEFIQISGTTRPGPQLPLKLYNHGMVAINQTYSMVIGGQTEWDAWSALTYYYDHFKQQWIDGPELSGPYHDQTGQQDVAILTDQVTLEIIVVVIDCCSTNILLNNEWSKGEANS